jgi:glyoxylase-like metal-dependent hydrolase (beta-lactamase superfamily II)/rhodanese-related sulfurtransferase
VEEANMTVAREIPAAELENELRTGANVAVIDIRSPDAYASWRLERGAGAIVNLSAEHLASDPAAAVALLAQYDALRVICTVGATSPRAVGRLAEHGVEASSVAGGMIGWSRVLQRSAVELGGPFEVVQFRREARGCLSYLVGARGEALVVDPAPDVDVYLDEAARRGLRIVHVFDTHVHADHLSGARELAERAGAVLSLSRGALQRGVRYADRIAAVDDGDVIEIGGAAATVIALPGHTTDMTGLLLADVALVGGDSLFADSIARPDLEAGDDGAAEAARQLYRTLRDRVATLRDDLLLLPCHYAGGRVEGAVVASLGEVRRDVPELALDEDAFVERLLSQMPPKPLNYVAIIGVNMGDEPLDDAATRLEVGANNCAAKVEWARQAG